MGQIKMNNTKSSRLTVNKTKTASFRVFLKQRTNQHEIIGPSQQLRLLNDSRITQGDNLAKKDSISKMKDFVRNRIKTEHSAASQYRQNAKERPSLRDTPMNITAIDRFIPKQTQSNRPHSLSNLKVVLGSDDKIIKSDSKSKLSLRALQQKAEGLLMKKLKHCSAFKSQFSHQLEQEMRQLIKEIRETECSNTQRDSVSSVATINNKILLIQKMMAQNMAQADIMRKHLLSRIANKAKIRRLKTEHISNNSQLSYRDSDHTKEVVVNTSINQETFRSPAPPAYNIYRYKQENFNADRHRQPLPRSSYNRDFLQYDQMKESGIIPRENMIMGRSSSANVFRSSYRDSFGPKRTTIVNFRELDACKDKIKNYPIDFGRKSGTASGGLHYDICRQGLKARRYEQSPGVPGKYLLSESRREFKQEQCPSVSAIKHANLQKMHYQYKHIHHA